MTAPEQGTDLVEDARRIWREITEDDGGECGVTRIIRELADEVDRLRLAAPVGWRDISSAPKDGTMIVLDGPNFGHPLVGKWFLGGKMMGGWWVANTMPIQPTQWLALPPREQAADVATEEQGLALHSAKER